MPQRALLAAPGPAAEEAQSPWTPLWPTAVFPPRLADCLVDRTLRVTGALHVLDHDLQVVVLVHTTSGLVVGVSLRP
jgi:hypothetical protein